ncbi:MAG: hypothetical protein PHH77_10475 [Victivallaceae bacterium]|nr:hypothetical protein [Victivallaceae bacterium]
MRIKCPYCQSKTIVTHHEEVDKRVSYVYVTCTNHDCHARSKIRISYAGTLTPPVSDLTAAMHEWFANLPEAEQKAIAKTYQPALF